MEIYANVEFTVENTVVTCPVGRIVALGKIFSFILGEGRALQTIDVSSAFEGNRQFPPNCSLAIFIASGTRSKERFTIFPEHLFPSHLWPTEHLNHSILLFQIYNYVSFTTNLLSLE